MMKIELGGRVFYPKQPHVFSAGEVHANLKDIVDHFPVGCTPSSCIITMNILSSDDFFNLVQVISILRQIQCTAITLILPYLPYSRQDRICARGDSFSLKVFANLLNSLELQSVITYDVHSEVSQNIINNLINIPMTNCINEWGTLKGFIGLESDKRPLTFVAPDKGAHRKVLGVKDLFIDLKPGLIVANKVRDTNTGKITTHSVEGNVYNTTCIIFDDICDGGATFIGLAKQLRSLGAYKVHLYVTHGIFSKGTEELKLYIDSIFCYNNISKTNPQDVRFKNGI
jgi:ribose-phosphate pyrophosphokinase